MSRSNAVREEALRLDGNRCQITGYDGRSEEGRRHLEVHHVRPLGVGGSDEKDVVENCITLQAHVHVMVETGQLVIAEWDRANGVLSVIDNQDVLGHGVGKVDISKLWFYRRHDAEEGQAILTQLSSFAMLDSTIAERVYRLGQVVAATDPDARTLRECLASKGLDTRRLIGAASLWAKSLHNDVPWQDGTTVSDYRRLLKESGHGSKRKYFYVRIRGSVNRIGERPEVYYRTAYEQELRDEMVIGDRLYKLAKTVYGIRAENGHLMRPDGSEEPFIHFVPKEA